MSKISGVSRNLAQHNEKMRQAQNMGLGIDERTRRAAAAAEGFEVSKSGMTLNFEGKERLGEKALVGPPKAELQSVQKGLKGGKSYYRLSHASELTFQGKSGEVSAKGKHLTSVLNKDLASGDAARVAKAESFMKKHGIRRLGKNGFSVETEGAADMKKAPGQGLVQRFGDGKSDWTSFGMGGLAGGAVLGGTLASASSGFSVSKMIASGGVGTASPGHYIGNVGGMGTMAAGAGVAQLAGFEGLAFKLRKQMKSYASDLKDQSMISMINNPGIPIEDLIFMFMAHMADKYEEKLRNKMEEAAIAEKKDRERERKMDQADMIGGMASIIPGVGPIIGSGIKLAAQESIRIKDAMDGGTKSSTLIASEVQVLMQKWKQMNEMLSNLSKSLHDMAMTPIRNIR